MKRQITMRKISGSRLLLLTLFLLSGCATQSESDVLPLPTPSPAVTESPLPEASESPAPKNETVGQAFTKIYDNIPERNQNLALAIKAIDGIVLKSGEVFSFNKTVGPRTAEKGYKEAIGYDENGEKTPTVGGGVCQISSTLYMAALNGNFEIIERHSHSHEVPYADSDHDATVSYGGYDFRFQNNRDKPVEIHVAINEEKVFAELILLNKS